MYYYTNITISLVFGIIFLFLSACNNKVKQYSKEANTDIVEGAFNNCVYNEDSTFCVSVRKSDAYFKNKHNFFVLNDDGSDTIFSGNNRQYFLSWLNDSIMIFREKHGILLENNRTDLSSRENYVDYTLNVHTIQISQFKSVNN